MTVDDTADNLNDIGELTSNTMTGLHRHRRDHLHAARAPRHRARQRADRQHLHRRVHARHADAPDGHEPSRSGTGNDFIYVETIAGHDDDPRRRGRRHDHRRLDLLGPDRACSTRINNGYLTIDGRGRHRHADRLRRRRHHGQRRQADGDRADRPRPDARHPLRHASRTSSSSSARARTASSSTRPPAGVTTHRPRRHRDAEGQRGQRRDHDPLDRSARRSSRARAATTSSASTTSQDGRTQTSRTASARC